MARAHPQLRVVFPMHANLRAREAIQPAVAGLANVTLTGPLAYGGFARLMKRATACRSMAGAINPYGDGRAAPRSVAAPRRARSPRWPGISAGGRLPVSSAPGRNCARRASGGTGRFGIP